MNEFLLFFADVVRRYPMHLEIDFSKICDWSIYIYKKGCEEDGEDLEICFVQDGDVQLVFAKAYVRLKEFLIEHEGGY